MTNPFKRLLFSLLLVLPILIVVTGCTTLADARHGEGQGERRTYKTTYDNAWRVVISSVNSLGLAVASENKADGYILAQRGMTAFSMGENVAIFLRQTKSDGVSVEVVSKKAMTTNIFAPNWSEEILGRVDRQLK